MQDRGFTLVETLVAMAVLCVGALGGLQLVATAFEMMGRARAQTLAATAASARLEQLRSLRFEFDQSGLAVTDSTTSLAGAQPADGGGGLGAPGGSLDANVIGYADFLDPGGGWIGAGPTPPPGAAFVRRWSIEPADPGGDLVVIQVLVRPLAAGSAGAVGRLDGGARYVSLLARTQR